ncbi:MAG: hypothetical protein HZA53_07080 [Planctomycetes bacterium]|nr:hypothetical protein [Planctomycetota bacterium]
MTEMRSNFKIESNRTGLRAARMVLGMVAATSIAVGSALQVGGSGCDCPAADSYGNTTGCTVVYISIVKHDAICSTTCHTGTDSCYVDVTYTLGSPCATGPFTLKPSTPCETADAEARRHNGGAITVTVVCGECSTNPN